MLNKLCLLPTLLFCFFSAQNLTADTIVIEVSAIASGSLGNQNFTAEMITITGTGDTDDVFVEGSSNLLLEGLEVTVAIDGIGSAVFTDAIQAVSNNNSELGGFGNTSNNNGLILVFNEAFENYDLLSGLEPVAGFGVIVIGIPHETDVGSFRLFEIMGNATYSSSVTPACPFQPGDVNEDGAVNLLDVGPFVDSLFTDFFICQSDINQDGTVDLLDVNPFVLILAGD